MGLNSKHCVTSSISHSLMLLPTKLGWSLAKIFQSCCMFLWLLPHFTSKLLHVYIKCANVFHALLKHKPCWKEERQVKVISFCCWTDMMLVNENYKLAKAIYNWFKKSSLCKCWRDGVMTKPKFEQRMLIEFECKSTLPLSNCQCLLFIIKLKTTFFRMLKIKGGATTGLWSHLEHIHPDIALDQDLTRDNATSNPFAI